MCFTVSGILGFGDLGQFLASPAVFWPISGAICSGLLVWGKISLFRPSYGELIKDRNEKIGDLENLRELLESEKANHAVALKEARSGHQDELQLALDTLVTQLLEYVCKESYDCRLSAYSVEGEEFLLLSRCSRNPLLEVRGRASYPLTEGNIGVAWAKSWTIQDYAATDRAQWEEALADSGLFPPETASLLTMQSHSVYAQRIDRSDQKLGMLVFECENPDRFDANSRKKVQSSYILKTIAELLSRSHQLFPRVLARQEELTNSIPSISIPEPRWKSAKRIGSGGVVESIGNVDGAVPGGDFGHEPIAVDSGFQPNAGLDSATS